MQYLDTAAAFQVVDDGLLDLGDTDDDVGVQPVVLGDSTRGNASFMGAGVHWTGGVPFLQAASVLLDDGDGLEQLGVLQRQALHVPEVAVDGLEDRVARQLDHAPDGQRDHGCPGRQRLPGRDAGLDLPGDGLQELLDLDLPAIEPVALLSKSLALYDVLVSARWNGNARPGANPFAIWRAWRRWPHRVAA